MEGVCRLGLYEKAVPYSMEWKEKFCTVKECGYDFMEISIDETEKRLARLYMTSEERTEIRRAMEQNDFYLESMCLSGHRRFPLGSRNRIMRERSLEIMERAILLARDLGIRTIQLAGYDVYYEPSAKETVLWFKENLKRCVDWAEQYHVMLAFETMETPFLNTVKKCMEYINEIKSPWLQIYPDTGNLTNAAGGNREQIFADMQSGKGHLVAMHLKESRPGKFRDLVPGEGYVDFAGIICEAKALGVRRFTAEIWHHDGQDWEEQINRTYRYLIKKFKEGDL